MYKIYTMSPPGYHCMALWQLMSLGTQCTITHCRITHSGIIYIYNYIVQEMFTGESKIVLDSKGASYIRR